MLILLQKAMKIQVYIQIYGDVYVYMYVHIYTCIYVYVYISDLRILKQSSFGWLYDFCLVVKIF